MQEAIPNAVAVIASEVEPRRIPSAYPEPFASRMHGRLKRALGDLFGLSHFGVNLTTLAPGAVSALLHAHSRQDEFVYVLQGHPVLRTDGHATPLAPGMCIGFRAGAGTAHQLVNHGQDDVVILEVGDRSADDRVAYPEDDLVAVHVDGVWRFNHKNGTPYGPER